LNIEGRLRPAFGRGDALGTGVPLVPRGDAALLVPLSASGSGHAGTFDVGVRV
jgi:hypothetical protein